MRRVAASALLAAAPVASALLCGCPRSSTSTSASDAGAPSAGPVLVEAGAMNALGVPPEEVSKFVNPHGLLAYVSPTGSVEGTISVVGPAAPDTPGSFEKCPAAASVYGKLFREGAPRADGSRALADTIVAVTGYSGYFVPEKDEDARITIEGCAFDRRTVTMTFGQRLEVKNLSTEFWSPMLAPAPNPVIMMAPPKGDPVRLYPKRPGRYRLHDHDRTYANADLFAFLHPLHTVTDKEGHYRIDGVPVGKLKVNARHPKFEAEASKDIEVQANVVVKVDLTLTYAPPDGGTPDGDAGPYRPPIR